MCEITNEERAERAEAAVTFYVTMCKGEKRDALDAEITDLMTDLLHLAASAGENPHNLAYRAMGHYEEECEPQLELAFPLAPSDAEIEADLSNRVASDPIDPEDLPF